MIAEQTSSGTLNGICPYFTMFPIEFPLGILANANDGDVVLDPFCGRGTTNFAARMLGMRSVGVDSSPVAAAITASKLVDVLPFEIIDEARSILDGPDPRDVPESEFWSLAFERSTLANVCKFREAFLEDCTSAARVALRGIILGALHGPRQKTVSSYFSNQCPRTYAPKPAYSVRFWRDRGLLPVAVDAMEVIRRRASRYYSQSFVVTGEAVLGDSRSEGTLKQSVTTGFSWIVTSPPYYGMRTYVPDQWLRNWFVGGPAHVSYDASSQLQHRSPGHFSSDLRSVWRNIRKVSKAGASLVVRFGGIADRSASPHEIIQGSLSGLWDIQTIKAAGLASDGRRQANSFLKHRSLPVEEFVVWAQAS